MVAAAVIGAAVVGAAGSAVAGSEAASATQNSTNAAITQQQSALTQQENLSAPYRALGTNNMQTYQNLLTGGPSGAAGIESTLQSLPGYKTTLATGTEAAQRSAAASGLNLSGNQVAGTEAYGANLADSTYQTELSNMLQPIQLGQAAAAGTAANVGASANNTSNLITTQGTNTANIDANEIAGLTKATSSGINQYATLNTLNNLNNPGSTPTYNPSGASGVNYDGSGNSIPTYSGPATTPGYS